MTDPNRLSFAAFARLVEVTPGRISQAVKEGKLTVETDEQGIRYLDGERALREWRLNTDQAKAVGPRVRDARRRAAANGGGSEDDPDLPTLHDSRVKLEYFKAAAAEVSYRKEIGELVEAARVRREAFESARALREAILSVPDRLASELAAETDPNRVHARITEELAIALTAVADRADDLEDEAPADGEEAEEESA